MARQTKEEVAEKVKLRYRKDPALRERIKQASYAWMSTHPEQRLLKQARDSAKQRGLDFNITVEDIVIPNTCPYLGVVLTTTNNGGRQDDKVSLDRIDNTKGYVKGNIQVISSKANFMKRNATIEELIQFAHGILDTHT